ncbi:hypothetical protein NA57DRAFT_14540, partial [Rhizodiscina lignyota]
GNNNPNLCLSPNVISTGSQSNGQEDGGELGQAPSAISANNFIEFCKGETITNGLQNKGGSCNPIPMGKMPAFSKMTSTIIISPQAGEDMPANQAFDISVRVANLQPGTFTNPSNTYYSAPQDLNGQGIVIGHTHITVQDMGGSMNPAQPLDAGTFAFFKGINNAGDGQGTLSATVTGGLGPGFYRVCTITAAGNHQPVLMPVANRGGQDDCQKFTVGQGRNADGGGAGNNNNGEGSTDENEGGVVNGGGSNNNGDDANQNENAGTRSSGNNNGA